MKAIRLHHTGPADVLELEDIPLPKPGPGEALVRIRAAGLNFADIYMRNGSYPAPISLPFTPGLEGAGVVEAVGEGVAEASDEGASSVRPGDRVSYLALQYGAYADYQIVKANHLIPLPPDISFETAAAITLQGMTAHALVYENYPVKPGVAVLVHAAAGGMGLLLVQWLKHLGACVIGTVSTEEKAQAAREAGAHHAILYTRDDFASETKRLTNGKGADYIIDGVGKSTFSRNLDAVSTRGHITLYGWSSGAPDSILPEALMAKSIAVSGGGLGNFINTHEEIRSRARAVFEGVQAGWLKPRVDRVFPLAQAAEAHRLLENRQTIGKLVLAING
jgi:NADPH:quinone reductase